MVLSHESFSLTDVSPDLFLALARSPPLQYYLLSTELYDLLAAS